MTKKEFLTTLASGLKDLPPNTVSDILFDYQDYFNSQKNSLNEEEMIKSLGPIDKIIENYYDEYSISHPSTKTLDMTDEYPIIDTTFIEAEPTISKASTSESFISNTYDEPLPYSNSSDFKKEQYSEPSSRKKEKFKGFSFTSKKKSSSKVEPTSTKEKSSTKKSLLGYAFSLPLLAISIPVGLGLGLASFVSYISVLLLIFVLGFSIFTLSLAPLICSIAGFLVILCKSLGVIIFTNIPTFILDFPTAFIIFISISALFLAIGIFSLGISYCRASKRTILRFSKALFKIVFRRAA